MNPGLEVLCVRSSCLDLLWPIQSVCVCPNSCDSQTYTHTHKLTREAKFGAPFYGSVSPSAKFRRRHEFEEEFDFLVFRCLCFSFWHP